ncbi:MAG TPA: hypothetical protein VEV62_08790 [Parafilimonas sp.]|nr:hypothetical protein [Parafilimonas sp.]
MKKVLLAVLMLFSICSFSAVNSATNPVTKTTVSDDGRHISASQVPDAVIKSFNKHFPNAKNVSWEVDREHGSKVYEASFKLNGQCKRAEFLPGGALLEVRNRDCNSGDGSGDN